MYSNPRSVEPLPPRIVFFQPVDWFKVQKNGFQSAKHSHTLSQHLTRFYVRFLDTQLSGPGSIQPRRPRIVFYQPLVSFTVQKKKTKKKTISFIIISYQWERDTEVTIFTALCLFQAFSFWISLIFYPLCSIKCHLWILLQQGIHIKANPERFRRQESRLGNSECR